MKQDEIVFKTKKRYLAVMLICLLYGGFSLIEFLDQGYTAFWRTEVANAPIFDQNHSDDNHDSTNSVPFSPDYNRGPFTQRFARDPIAELTSPISLTYLFGGIISIIAGLSIWRLLHEKEVKKIKMETANHLLLPEERTVIEFIKKSGNECTQASLTKETGLTRVQVHRTINRLEAKGVLEKHKYGLTNKIVLKKEIFE